MIHWPDIDTVLLDMDGTLLDLYFDNFFWQDYLPRRFAAERNIPEDEAFTRIKAWIDHHLGTLNWYCLDFWSRELDLNVAAIKREVADRIAVRPGAEDFLGWLAGSGKQVVMVTNAHPDALALKVERTGIDRYFHRLYTSHQFGVAKEEPGFWDALRADEPFEPARALLIDDSDRVLRAARDYGIGAVLSVRQPDSSLPPREDTAPFAAVDDFHSLIEVDHAG
jgi:HAD superfamily hydrolase (TIGR01509 family)